MHLKQVLFLLAIYALIIRQAAIKSAGPGKSEEKETVKKGPLPPAVTQGAFIFNEKKSLNIPFTGGRPPNILKNG